MSSSEQHRLIKEILYQVSLLTPAARAEFLSQACAEDADLRREVESLLRYQDECPDAETVPGESASPAPGATRRG